jgi:NADPH:quinone reductase
MLANVNLERDFEALALFGRIVVVGNRGSVEFTPRQAMTKEATIFGMSLFNSSSDDRREIHNAIRYGLENGSIDPPVSRSFPLSEAAVSHHEVIEQKANGKIVLIP